MGGGLCASVSGFLASFLERGDFAQEAAEQGSCGHLAIRFGYGNIAKCPQLFARYFKRSF